MKTLSNLQEALVKQHIPNNWKNENSISLKELYNNPIKYKNINIHIKDISSYNNFKSVDNINEIINTTINFLKEIIDNVDFPNFDEILLKYTTHLDSIIEIRFRIHFLTKICCYHVKNEWIFMFDNRFSKEYMYSTNKEKIYKILSK